MNPTDFRRASEATEGWLTFVSMAVHLGTNPVDSNVDMAYRFFFLSPGSTRQPVSEQYDTHRPVLREWAERVRGKSDGPVEWQGGRGVVENQYWSSAHEAAVNITDITLHLLALPGWYLYAWEEEDEPVKELSPAEQMEHGRARLTALSEGVRLTFDEANRLKERIRRERAAVLGGLPTEQIDDLPPADLRFSTEAELPPEFKDLDGTPLGREYLKASAKWTLRGSCLSKAKAAGKLTRFAHVGRKMYHSYPELLALRDRKTDGIE